MKDIMYEKMATVEESHWWYKGKRDIVVGIVEQMSLPQDALIADFGCGTGAMLKNLQRFGQICGMDYNERALDFCREKLDCNLKKIDLGQEQNFDHQYDLAIALDLLEHIDNDLIALSNMKNALNSGGKLIITVPAFEFLWSAHDENCMHKRRYNISGLKNLIAGAGLDIDYISYYNFWLFPPVFLFRVIRKLFRIKNDNSMENSTGGFFTQKIIYKIFASESFFVRRGFRFPFGVSLIAVLKNKKSDKGDE